jgi:predicted MPP superfamily phosphohydrolase
LQLSGHAHKGQIFPFNFVTEYIYPIDNSFLELPNQSFLYVSRGSGTWGPPIRILSPPEVTVIDLIHDSKKVSISEVQKGTGSHSYP